MSLEKALLLTLPKPIISLGLGATCLNNSEGIFTMLDINGMLETVYFVSLLLSTPLYLHITVREF